MTEASFLPADLPRATDPRARRRPGLVALLYGYRALAGLFIALPAAVAVGTPTLSWPRGPAELFDPGGLMLLEALRLSRRALLPIETAAGMVAAVVLLAGIFPLAALLVGLDRGGRLSGTVLVARTWAHAGTLALITGLGALFQALVCGVVVLLGGKVIGALHFVQPAHDVADGVLLGVVGLFGLVTGVLRDLASVAAVRGGHGLYDASARALRCARYAGGRALLAWTWRASLGLAGILGAAWFAPALAGASAAAIAVGVVLHQGAIAGATFARASWLAAAMRLYDATEPKVEAAVERETVEESRGEAASVEAAAAEPVVVGEPAGASAQPVAETMTESTDPPERPDLGP